MSVVPIPDSVTFSYNGFTFPSNVRTKVIEKPVMSGDGRTVKYSELTITVSGIMTQDDADAYAAANFGQPGAPLDVFMLSVRRQLQAAGKDFRYVGKGYGLDLSIGSNSQMFDVAFGPKPGAFTWFSLGGMPDGCHAAGFDWSIVVNVAECSAFQNVPGVFLEISFTVNYDTDEAGIVTITYSGNLQIPLALQANNTLAQTIDDIVARAIRPVPVGFLRRMSRQLSADRASCTVSITDRQVEYPYPENVVRIEMRERIRQEKKFAPLWVGSITGTVRLDPVANKFLAWRRFFSIAAQRISAARHFVGSATGNPRNVLVTTVEFEEDLFSNESRFTVNFRIMGVRLGRILLLSGMWRPIMNGDPAPAYPWDAERWTASLRFSAQKTKGLLGASFGRNQDIVIDVCTGPVVSVN